MAARPVLGGTRATMAGLTLPGRLLLAPVSSRQLIAAVGRSVGRSGQLLSAASALGLPAELGSRSSPPHPRSPCLTVQASWPRGGSFETKNLAAPMGLDET